MNWNRLRVLRVATIMAVVVVVQIPSRGAAAPARDIRCGAYCLYVALLGLDVPVPPFEEFASQLGKPSDAGFSMAQLADGAAKHNAQSLGVVTSVKNLRLRRDKFACIALMKEGHFILVTGLNDDVVQIIDPPNDSAIPIDTLKTVWPGNALLISKLPLAPEDSLRESRWLSYVGIACAVAAAFAALAVWVKRPK